MYGIWSQNCTRFVYWVPHRKLRETKQHPSREEFGHQLSCRLLFLHFLWGILRTGTVQSSPLTVTAELMAKLFSAWMLRSFSQFPVEHPAHKHGIWTTHLLIINAKCHWVWTIFGPLAFRKTSTNTGEAFSSHVLYNGLWLSDSGFGAAGDDSSFVETFCSCS